MTPNNPGQSGTQPIPTWVYAGQDANDWYLVYSALCRHAIANPELARQPENQAARQLAYDRFNAAFEVL